MQGLKSMQISRRTPLLPLRGSLLGAVVFLLGLLSVVVVSTAPSPEDENANLLRGPKFPRPFLLYDCIRMRPNHTTYEGHGSILRETRGIRLIAATLGLDPFPVNPPTSHGASFQTSRTYFRDFDSRGLSDLICRGPNCKNVMLLLSSVGTPRGLDISISSHP